MPFESKVQDAKAAEYVENFKYPLSGAITPDFKKSEACFVDMSEFAVTTATSQQPVLASLGAFTCVILALYNADQQLALLAHIPPTTRVETIHKIINLMPTEGTVAHLYGSVPDPEFFCSEEMCYEIIKALEDKQITIANADILRDRAVALDNPASLAIDARTGDISTSIEPEHFDLTPELRKRVTRHDDKPIYFLKQIHPTAKSSPHVALSIWESRCEKRTAVVQSSVVNKPTL